MGARDFGNPQRNSSVRTIIFQIVDVNDNNPVFNQSAYFVSVPENSPLNTVVVRTSASDGDFSARIGYSLNRENWGRKFDIDNCTVSTLFIFKLKTHKFCYFITLLTGLS